MENKKVYFPVMLEQDENGIYIVSCPSFIGCHSYGKTIEEAMENIHEAIELCLEDEKPKVFNRFIGFREVEMNIAV